MHPTHMGGHICTALEVRSRLLTRLIKEVPFNFKEVPLAARSLYIMPRYSFETIKI
jgi:hypothetical protein